MWFHGGMDKPPHTLCSLFARSRVVLLDGAWGTALFPGDAVLQSLPARAVLDAPDRVTALARDYLQAGAQALTTNTFRATVPMLGAALADTLNRTAVRLLFDVGASCILGSIAPLQGEVDWQRAHYQAQAASLIAAGCRTLLLETFTQVGDVTIAITACRDAGAEEVVACMYLGPGEQHAAEKLQRLVDAGADIVGVNCVNGPLAAALPMQGVKLGVPLIARPNAGQALKGGQPITPEDFAAQLPTLLEARATFIGGCCGTTPAHVEALRAALCSSR